ncbi:hypothetical protein I3F58_06940 [Streptomyces sp. MUM 203J]|uniref:hypothetical protein n=1 Tax=Streptomyces sp. MUM 203J TaxID=2791990 RepID=UPI001F04C41E|nr:hypothetical protein [Streptomyces sp. MUM 203J]MCH0539299.1 hypothetical protein [Streptomyces sp. MUM 203J]
MTVTTAATRHDRRMYALMNRAEGASLHATAARRRAWVAAHVVLTGGYLAALLATVRGDALWPAFVLLGLLAPWCLAMGVINGATRGLFELRAHMLDERQRAERDRARALGHRFTGGALLGFAVATGAANWLGGVEFSDVLFPVSLTAFAVHAMMPRWIACLRVEDAPEDDLHDEAVSVQG